VTVTDLLQLGDMFGESFMRNAFLAGTAIAVAAGLTGYFVVLRGQVFTGDALSHVAFTGALAALAAGIDVRLGLFAAVLAVALLLGVLGDRGRADDVAIGAVFAWVLGLGVLFLSLFTANRSSTNSAAGVNVLFGSIFGFDAGRAWWATAASIAVVIVLLAILRPLLFASIDPIVAAASGVPVRALGFGFLLLVGVVAGVAAQAVGALLLLALLAAPAAAAQHLTVRPAVALMLSAGIAVGSMWIGLAVSYRVDDIPPSFAITATLTICYVVSALWAKTRSAAHASAERGIMPGHDRDSGAAIEPAAADRGLAGGRSGVALFRRVRAHPRPDW
jgi:zinc/manganese transport system permease protein